MTRNWTPRDALIEVMMEHLYVCAPGEVEARRIIKAMANEMLREVEEAGYAFVRVEPDAAGQGPAAESDAGRAH